MQKIDDKKSSFVTNAFKSLYESVKQRKIDEYLKQIKDEKENAKYVRN